MGRVTWTDTNAACTAGKREQEALTVIIAQLEMTKMIEIDVETMPTSVDVSRTKSRVAGCGRVAHRNGDKERSNANRRAPSRGTAPLWSVRMSVLLLQFLLHCCETRRNHTGSEETIHDLPSHATRCLGVSNGGYACRREHMRRVLDSQPHPRNPRRRGPR